MTIISQAPCRISLVGGGTDVDPFASQYGGRVLNLAVSLYNQATLIPSQAKQIKLQALGETKTIVNLNQPLSYGQDQKLDLIYAIINHFRSQIPAGFSLTVTQTSDSLLGLGRSGSAAVAIISVFNHWLGKKTSPLDVGLLAAELETKELGWPGGKQDSLAAAFGGINLMSFGPGQKTVVNRLKLPLSTIKALEDRTLMVFIGGDRHSADQQKKLIKGMSDKDKLQALMALKAAVDPAVNALKQANWPALGRILHQGWLNKKKSNPAATNPPIDKIYQLARNQGAYGGKLSGSGGAGHMFFLIPPEKKSTAIKALINAGVKPVNFKFDFKGVTVKSYDH